MISSWRYFEGVGWLHLSGHVSSTICLAPPTPQRPMNDLFLFSANLSVQYEVLGGNICIKISRRPSPRTFCTHQIKGRVWLSHLDNTEVSKQYCDVMAPTHLSSGHPMCASRDRRAENSQLSQKLQLCLDPTFDIAYSNCCLFIWAFPLSVHSFIYSWLCLLLHFAPEAQLWS